MNTENEKRWFVYIGDHHEGPLSVIEVHEKKQKGQILPESYVWREGMTDWLMLSQVQELTQALNALAPAAPAARSEPAAQVQVEEPAVTAEASAPASEPEPGSAREEPRNAKPKKASKNHSAAPEITKAEKKGGGLLGKLLFWLISLAGFAVVLAIGVLAAGSRTSDTSLHSRIRPILQQIIAKAPFMRPIFRFVPAHPDLKPQDLAELEATRNINENPEARIAFALYGSEPTRTDFHIKKN